MEKREERRREEKETEKRREEKRGRNSASANRRSSNRTKTLRFVFSAIFLSDFDCRQMEEDQLLAEEDDSNSESFLSHIQRSTAEIQNRMTQKHGVVDRSKRRSVLDSQLDARRRFEEFV